MCYIQPVTRIWLQDLGLLPVSVSENLLIDAFVDSLPSSDQDKRMILLNSKVFRPFFILN